MMPSKEADVAIPSKPPVSLAPLSADFIRQQASKQIGNNYHSSSLSTMLPHTVNRTSLHPGGVEPQREHTEIEEELHELAHIDYDRVSIIANPSVAALYEDALVYETGSAITSTGALTAFSGAKTGRSPLDKRIVREPSSENEVWWGPVNKPMTPEVWKINRERAVDYLNTRNRIYVVDGFAGWDERYRINVRVVCARAYHALFMRNMLIRPSEKELEHFHPDYTIYNAGSFPANRFTTGMTSATSVAINFADKEMVILGTEYAGEMKKGVFTVLFYEMPVKHNVLTLHSSANEGKDGDVTVFFGLSGTGKTTLSADPKRALIGDDEHCWSDRGIFNIEGGCYAKTIGLSGEKEPDIFNAIRFGSILENVVFSPETRLVNYDDSTLTENTRCAYPIEYIQNAKIPCLSTNHPSNIILLTCDARGVLPPISKLTVEQTMFHFISGYTSKMAGTEDGVTEPQATFSSCFAQPFLALHPMRYARMLAEKIADHKANAWLLNTGWVGAGATTGGKRCPLKYTRAILDSIHSGELAKAEYETYETFNLHVPTSCPGVPSELLNPKRSWTGKADFKGEVTKLWGLFAENFKKYADCEGAPLGGQGAISGKGAASVGESASGGEGPTSGGEVVSSGGEGPTSGGEVVSEGLTQGGEVVPSTGESIPSAGEGTPSREEVAASGEEVAASGEEVAASTGEDAALGGAGATSGGDAEWPADSPGPDLIKRPSVDKFSKFEMSVDSIGVASVTV